MGYMQEFEARLRAVLENAPESAVERVVKIAKETVYESYKNGIEHGKLTREETQTPARRWRPAKRRGT